MFYGVASTVLGSGADPASRPGGGAAGTGPPVRDPGLLRRHPAPPVHRSGPGHLPRRQRAPHRRRRPPGDVAGVRRHHPGRRAAAGSSTPPTCRRRSRRPRRRRSSSPTTCGSSTVNELGRAGPTAPLHVRDRRIRQDRHRRDRVVARQRRGARTGSSGCARVIRGCSTGPSCSPTRRWRSGSPPTRWRRPRAPSRSPTCSCASKPPAWCCGSTPASSPRWPRRRRWRPGSSTCLRTVEHVVRLGHIQRVTRREIVLDGGTVALPPDSLVVHCAASGLQYPPLVPSGARTRSGSRRFAPASRASIAASPRFRGGDPRRRPGAQPVVPAEHAPGRPGQLGPDAEVRGTPRRPDLRRRAGHRRLGRTAGALNPASGHARPAGRPGGGGGRRLLCRPRRPATPGSLPSAGEPLLDLGRAGARGLRRRAPPARQRHRCSVCDEDGTANERGAGGRRRGGAAAVVEEMRGAAAPPPARSGGKRPRRP